MRWGKAGGSGKRPTGRAYAGRQAGPVATGLAGAPMVAGSRGEPRTGHARHGSQRPGVSLRGADAGAQTLVGLTKGYQGEDRRGNRGRTAEG
ncbi:MAG: hypothetical protein HYZ81_01695 [Nitrospinae bacterium]|nr:hypothetical protein [Nitrospinota bacterium]